MKNYYTAVDVVCDLHQKGFNNDFIIYQQQLYWVQENLILRATDFIVIEYHEITDWKNKRKKLTIYAIMDTDHFAKGILLNHHENPSFGTSVVLRDKLNELMTHTGVNYIE